MAIISLSGAYTAPKRRPKAYKAKDAAYSVGGNNGYYIAALPRPYPKNDPQKKIAKLAEQCKIKRGMSKSELQKSMKDCLTSENYDKVKV